MGPLRDVWRVGLECVLQTARERERDCRNYICFKYSSAVLPTEVSSIHFSSMTQIEVCFVSIFLRFSFVNVGSIWLPARLLQIKYSSVDFI